MSALAKEIEARVRPMRAADLEQVLVIERRVFDFPWSRNVFMSCFGQGYRAHILELHRTVIGYGVMLICADECHLVNLCVDPECQSRGFGRSLLTRMLDYATSRGVRRAVLEVRRSNTAALALYRSENFSQLSWRKNYYPTATGREDALVLAKLL